MIWGSVFYSFFICWYTKTSHFILYFLIPYSICGSHFWNNYNSGSFIRGKKKLFCNSHVDSKVKSYRMRSYIVSPKVSDKGKKLLKWTSAFGKIWMHKNVFENIWVNSWENASYQVVISQPLPKTRKFSFVILLFAYFTSFITDFPKYHFASWK